jgi:uncharacterized protein YukE
MAAEEFEVDFGGLRSAAARYAGVSESIAKVRERLVEADISEVSLGRLPASAQTRDTYAQRVERSLDDLQQLADAMQRASDRLRSTVEDYDRADGAAYENLRALLRRLEG